jgi:hypothetical protein
VHTLPVPASSSPWNTVTMYVNDPSEPEAQYCAAAFANPIMTATPESVPDYAPLMVPRPVAPT